MATMNRREFLKFASVLSLASLEMSPFRWVVREVAKADGENKPNVLIVVFDTLSALHTTLEGYHRETTPNIAQFAEQATSFHNHYAGGSFTTPGTASLLTGTYPLSHRAFQPYSEVAGALVPGSLFDAFNDSYNKVVYTHNPLVSILFNQFRNNLDHWKRMEELCLSDSRIAERLFSNDFYAAFGGDSQAYRLLNSRGTIAMSLMAKLFNRANGQLLKRQYGKQFPKGIPSGSHRVATNFLLEDVVDWLLDDLPNLTTPFLNYVHVYPPHEPYTPRQEFIGLFTDTWKPVVKNQFSQDKNVSQELLNTKRMEYDEYMAYADAEFGRLYSGLKSNGLLENTYLVLTSDHGQLFERGIHGHFTPALYEGIIRVPLVISSPGQKERQDVHTITSCIDLLPTLLHVTGQQIPDWCEGQVLPTFDSDLGVDDERAVIAVDAKTNAKFAPLTEGTVALVMGDHKIIRNLGGQDVPEGYEFYDLRNDPDEINDLYSTGNELAQEFQMRIDEFIKQSNNRITKDSA